MRHLLSLVCSLLVATGVAVAQGKLLIPMDLQQTDHLKAYGIAYWVLAKGGTLDWLLNYRGGAFMLENTPAAAAECRVRGVACTALGGAEAAAVYAEVQRDDNNMDVVRLEKAPKVAVYVPPGFHPWDDAVTLALEYAEIPYARVWDPEVLSGKLPEYDWLHLHHEDFTGQYGKFYASFAGAAWYQEQQATLEREAAQLGYRKVSEMKKAVARMIKTYIGGGGFLFAMCSATDTYDIALAAEKTDICAQMYDGDPADPDAQSRLDFNATLAFTERPPRPAEPGDRLLHPLRVLGEVRPRPDDADAEPCQRDPRVPRPDDPFQEEPHQEIGDDPGGEEGDRRGAVPPRWLRTGNVHVLRRA
jgi:hypothetical protein